MAATAFEREMAKRARIPLGQWLAFRNLLQGKRLSERDEEWITETPEHKLRSVERAVQESLSLQ